jgi:hypothetical protein
VTSLTKIQILLLRQLTEKPMSRSGRVPGFCIELEAQGYVKITPFNVTDLSVEITDEGRKALSDAKQSAGAAAPSGRRADEYEAPQNRRDVVGGRDEAKNRAQHQNPITATADIGLGKNSIHEARKIRDGKKAPSASPTLTHVGSSAYENEQGVHFPMMNGNMSVRVLVARSALQGEGRPPADGIYLRRFEAARAFFEILAREKFDPDHPTARVTITEADLLGGAIEAGGA